MFTARLLSVFLSYQGPVAADALAEESTTTNIYYAEVVLPKDVEDLENQRPLFFTYLSHFVVMLSPSLSLSFSLPFSLSLSPSSHLLPLNDGSRDDGRWIG